MEGIYFSKKRLEPSEVAEISEATGGQFGFTGVQIKDEFQYKLFLKGDSIPLAGLVVLDKYRMRIPKSV
jgi:hypothetical protein